MCDETGTTLQTEHHFSLEENLDSLTVICNSTSVVVGACFKENLKHGRGTAGFFHLLVRIVLKGITCLLSKGVPTNNICWRCGMSKAKLTHVVVHLAGGGVGCFHLC